MSSLGSIVTARLARLLGLLGFDRKVVTGLGAKLLGLCAGPLGAVITVLTLSVEKQGLYYLFASLLALRALFELGAGTSVVQISAHARTGDESPNGSPLEPAFVATVNHWMRRVATIYGVLAGVGGYMFLAVKLGNDPQTLLAWVAFIAISSLQFSSEGRWGLLDGADKVSEVNVLRIKNSIIQYVVQWSLLFCGAGLLSFCLGATSAYISQEIHFRTRYPWMYAPRNAQEPMLLKKYQMELVGLVKRASQTYIAGYFVFQVQQPICFHFLGGAASAKLGFTQSVGTAIIGVPSVWLAMNFPRLAHLVADNEITAARKLFKTKWIQLTCFTVMGFFMAWAATRVLGNVPRFADRFMTERGCLLLFTSLCIQTIAMGLIYWPRAFKVEPFVRVAYVQMIATPLLFYFMVRGWGLEGAAIASISTWAIGALGISLIAHQYWVRSEKTSNVS